MGDRTVKIAHVSLAEALLKGPPPAGNLAVPIFSAWHSGGGAVYAQGERPAAATQAG